MTCHVAFCFDRNFRQHFGAAVTSLLMSHEGPGEALTVHAVTDEVDDDLARRIDLLRRRFRATLQVYPVRERMANTLEGVPLSGGYPQTTYWSLLLADILPRDVERVLYLDSDLVVVSDLQALMDADLEGRTLGGVDDPSSSRLRAKWGVDRYINSGVMLIDLKRWRDRDYGHRCVAFSIAQGDHIEYLDQCAINNVLAGDIALLDRRWNGCVMPRIPPQRFEDAAILHFITGDKPWQAWYESPLGRHYWRYLDVSPWSGAKPVEPSSFQEKLRMANLLGRQGRHRDAVELFSALSRPQRGPRGTAAQGRP
jgi:lipopolysaccharide biosynthesis glycosyltransferase